MRILASVAIWILFVGGLALYMNQSTPQAAAPQASRFQAQAARAAYHLEIFATFSAQPDPFALQVADEPPPALVVRLGGQEILRKSEGLAADQAVRAEDIPVVLGANELYIEASPPLDSPRYQAVQARILQDDQVVAQKSFWAAPGSRIADSFSFEIEKEETGHAP